jgi:hypothetical protein
MFLVPFLITNSKVGHGVPDLDIKTQMTHKQRQAQVGAMREVKEAGKIEMNNNCAEKTAEKTTIVTERSYNLYTG